MQRYTNAIKKRVNTLTRRCVDAYNILLGRKVGPLDRYSNSAPSPQASLKLFAGDWCSILPEGYKIGQVDGTPLFDDDRIKWAIEQFGGVKGQKVLELGPLEGGHSYMCQKSGVSSVVAIEASPKSFLKCLVVKQAMELDRVDFRFGDFMHYLRRTLDQFDICIASGVLYHMQSPVELISLISKHSSKVFLWTHYYDPEVCGQFFLKRRFSEHKAAEFEGFRCTLHKYNYGSARRWSSFIGGPLTTSQWLSRQDILDCLRHFGFDDICVSFEVTDHKHGPSFAVTASKRKPF